MSQGLRNPATEDAPGGFSGMMMVAACSAADPNQAAVRSERTMPADSSRWVAADREVREVRGEVADLAEDSADEVDRVVRAGWTRNDWPRCASACGRCVERRKFWQPPSQRPAAAHSRHGVCTIRQFGV